ncbi:S8 family serine peptidase [Streptomyces sp. NPDC051677]|uniref:S8 family serine peptidase n=1 Tax=Streptomyces sp. NPDC051677 TaxID=3365669 RepID=UPI0037D05D8F
MKRAMTHVRAAVVVAVLLLFAGSIGPVAAEPTTHASAGASAGAGAGGGAARGIDRQRHLTLITGDRVTVDGRGRVVGLSRAPGRAHIPVQIRRRAGHTLVIPADAAALVAAGRLDSRLFDVTELSGSARGGTALKVIVGYQGAATAARADVRDAGTVRRTLTSLNADAVQTPQQNTPELWEAVTNGDRAAVGVAHVWLDGIRRASLDRSVPQIGAPKAWAAGYDGKGVRIAVLDTGIDTTHPDLKGQVVEEKNFSTAADAKDRFGHGTHVASTAAGTGAKSAGKYKGVAPGAKLLNAKVLNDEGEGEDSSIIAGMDWAAQQGADIVNVSLGGPDAPGADPMEAEVNKLSAEKGILFTIAAGNSGPESLGSPGAADAALTVGAVDGRDRLAEFSSTGPRVGDGAIKPDVTAPGVDITAASAHGSFLAREEGEKPPGYLTLSGTSMAAPHVAGAAAILKQRHPTWTYTQLKGALVGSAQGAGGLTPYAQGSGRIRVDRAIGQTVVADPVSLSFGVQRWPHTDDKPVTQQLTYRNLGPKAVTLKLTVTATDPRGRVAPAGFFTLGARTVTVPAGGEAKAGVRVDTRLGGTRDGAYSAYVTATGGGQSVRTAAAVQREVQSYDVTLKHIGRDGAPAAGYDTALLGYTGLATDRAYQAPTAASGTTTLRLPKGGYLLDAWIAADLVGFKGGVDWLVQPKLNVTRDTTVTIDARRTRTADITVPDAGAKPVSATISYLHGPSGAGVGLSLGSFADLRMAHLGPPTNGLTQTWSGQWAKGATAEYDVATTAKAPAIQGARVRHFKAAELATVQNTLGASAPGKTGGLTVWGSLPEDLVLGLPVAQPVPSARTLYVSTSDRIQWTVDFEQYGDAKDEDGQPIAEAYYTQGDPRTLKPGRTYRNTFNRAVIGPHLAAGHGLFRDGDTLFGYLPLFADSAGHAGSSRFTEVATTLYRDGARLGTNKDPLFGEEAFKVPAGDARYTLTTSVSRSVQVATATTRVVASWTFRSKRPTGDTVTALPASTVRFGAATGPDSRAEAGRKTPVSVTVEGAARGTNLRSLTVWVSYDHGRTWTRSPVTGGRITVTNPAAGESVSFRATAVDRKGNTGSVSVYDAYYAR